ncbi:adenosylcobinamide amidohydrolase [Ornithinimicrobium sp. INDO-MA30-4]|uniref:adenosylcobinamide amidohydrolase n=1 Tax=Ornithinimicrobium sp. INDO-MA30-4 TaxID=2908651 RepID=UPI001F2D81DE|nr:adenosylcobinamide amidohydrolase [Ornithinimicrobium sp. INDO-MA30-4]UJH69953.1 adenosylcobinamide amidohydrolase [Ornithinimicrobium sp. INDO-MA30-4]
MLITPTLHPPATGHRGLLSWVWPQPVTVLSSAAVGGGLREATSMINFGVPLDYARMDLDVHASEIAKSLGMADDPVALLTAADVSRYQNAEFEGVLVTSTVGVTKPTWAADRAGGWMDYHPGTINIVVQLPVVLSESALVNAVMTLTEAKTQALVEFGVPGTGTASDAVAIVCPTARAGHDVEVFAGPRSLWGSRLAIAVYDSVLKVLRSYS